MQQDLSLLSRAIKTWDWIENNRTQAAQIVVAVVLTGLVVGYYVWNQGEKQVRAGEALSRVSLNATVSGQDTATTVDEYLKVESSFRGTKAGGAALVEAGTALFGAAKYDEAQTLFVRFMHDYSTSPMVPQAALGVAASLDAQGKLDEALQQYKNILTRFPNANVVPQAKFSIARILEAQNKLPEAAAAYEELVSVLGINTTLGSEAGIRSAELDRKLRSTKPAVAEAPAVVPSMPADFKLTATTNLLK